jgi:hypothetical protein
MAAKTYQVATYTADVRMHDDRLVIKIETQGRIDTSNVYQNLVALGIIKPIKLD